ncbi:hypothetical protein H0H81_007605 [Sphagnurus paluster]|uniref:Uncharacterized protein n=1 Tax=Sphagnurus paluster TaxID=117069 RepID=A0A9P7GJE9_9AGAR|nr:hypothetical protein H0H81_007605 [Sphagnurus paluster]
MCRRIGSPRLQAFVVNCLPGKRINRLRNIIKVMDDTAIEIFEKKKMAMAQGDEALSNEIAGGKDIMSILIKANPEAAEVEILTDKEVIGQPPPVTMLAREYVLLAGKCVNDVD